MTVFDIEEELRFITGNERGREKGNNGRAGTVKRNGREKRKLRYFEG